MTHARPLTHASGRWLKRNSVHSPKRTRQLLSLVCKRCLCNTVLLKILLFVLLSKLECKFLEGRDHTLKENSQSWANADWLVVAAWNFEEGSCVTREEGASQSVGSVYCGPWTEEGWHANWVFLFRNKLRLFVMVIWGLQKTHINTWKQEKEKREREGRKKRRWEREGENRKFSSKTQRLSCFQVDPYFRYSIFFRIYYRDPVRLKLEKQDHSKVWW